MQITNASLIYLDVLHKHPLHFVLYVQLDMLYKLILPSVYHQHVVLELMHLQVMEFALLAPLAVLLVLLRLSVNRVLPAM